MSDSILPDFAVSISQPVQWGEQDGFGHVNNMHFIRWFESARIAYLIRCDVEIAAEGVGPILAAVSCNYRKQVKFPDTLVVGAKVTRIGRSSLTLEHALWSTTQSAIVADGDSTVVMFDYENQKSSPVDDILRKKIEEVEGRALS